MILANSSNLIITFITSNERIPIISESDYFSRDSYHSIHSTTFDEFQRDDQDEIVDLIDVTLDDNSGSGGSGKANDDGILYF